MLTKEMVVSETLSRDVVYDVTANVSLPDDAPQALTITYTARVRVAPNVTVMDLVKRAAQPIVINQAAKLRKLGYDGLKAKHGATIDIDITAPNTPATPAPRDPMERYKAGLITREQAIAELQAMVTAIEAA